MFDSRRVPAYLSAVALAASLSACREGGIDGPTRVPAPTPTPPPPRVVAQLTGAPLEVDVVGLVQFTTTLAGSLDALASSESRTAKPETIRVASAAAGAYTIFVFNAGSADESVSLQVVLTPSATGAASLMASSRSSQGLPFRLKGRPRGGVELR